MQIRGSRDGKKLMGEKKKQRPETEDYGPKKKCLWDVNLGTASVGRVRK